MNNTISSDKKIIHIDMDAFYVSVEIRDNPQLANKPVAVGGKSNTRSVLSTCNYIARKFGVSSAMPASFALKKCPDLIIVPGRMEVYKETSLQLRQIFERYTSIIEPLSLDEAYLDVTDCTLFNGSATLIAKDIRLSIQKELNLTASAGIAPLKYLAKIASDLNKPNGQFVITPKEVESFIDKLSLKKISGVGKVTFKKLKDSGFEFGRDVKTTNQHFFTEKFGKLGQSLWQRCQGLDNRPIETSRVRKSVGVEKTFSEDINDVSTLNKFLLENLIPELKKRSAKYLTTNSIGKLGIKVKFKDFQQTTKECQYQNFDNQLFCQLLDSALVRGNGKAVRLLGVHIGLNDANESLKQLELRF